MQVSPVAMSHSSPAAPFAAVYKRPLKEEEGLLLGFLFLLWEEAFTLGFFVVGSFWKGKELLKVKELLKGNC
jgi:hypothetical protein